MTTMMVMVLIMGWLNSHWLGLEKEILIRLISSLNLSAYYQDLYFLSTISPNTFYCPSCLQLVHSLDWFEILIRFDGMSFFPRRTVVEERQPSVVVGRGRPKDHCLFASVKRKPRRLSRIQIRMLHFCAWAEEHSTGFFE